MKKIVWNLEDLEKCKNNINHHYVEPVNSVIASGEKKQTRLKWEIIDEKKSNVLVDEKPVFWIKIGHWIQMKVEILSSCSDLIKSDFNVFTIFQFENISDSKSVSKKKVN